MVRCTYQGKSDDRCLMLKAQGTHHCKFHVPLKFLVFQFCFHNDISADYVKIMALLLDFHIFLPNVLLKISY